jgi:hypothetical protein
MSLTNAISAIAVVAAILIAGGQKTPMLGEIGKLLGEGRSGH